MQEPLCSHSSIENKSSEQLQKSAQKFRTFGPVMRFCYLSYMRIVIL